jgi:hypothetical protein
MKQFQSERKGRTRGKLLKRYVCAIGNVQREKDRERERERERERWKVCVHWKERESVCVKERERREKKEEETFYLPPSSLFHTHTLSSLSLLFLSA